MPSHASAPPPAASPQEGFERLDRLYRAGRLDEAAALAAKLEAAWPNVALFALIHGLVEAGRGRRAASEAAFRRALAIDPRSVDAHYNYAFALIGWDEDEPALAHLHACLEVQPGHLLALNNLGAVLERRGDYAGAIAACRRALAIEPRFADALVNLASAQVHAGHPREALATLATLDTVAPGHAEGANCRGVAFVALGEEEAAIGCFRQAVARKPGLEWAWFHLGQSLLAKSDVAGARAAAERAIALRPGFDHAIALRLHALAQQCDWAALANAADAVRQTGLKTAVVPFTLFGLDDSPERQHTRAAAYAAHTFGRAPAPSALPARVTPAGERLRIGYISADFHEHATMHLMAGVLREHDTLRFEVHAFSLTSPAQAAPHPALAHCAAVHDLSGLDDAAAVALVRAQGLDLAIDLKGYTAGERLSLFAARLAPVQAHYLGYPGTLANGFIDYLVADPFLVPTAERGHYGESLILLPDTYQANDNQRVIGTAPGTRADHGLPESGFVFGCFNNAWKIGEAEFAIWLRLLRAVEGSVLWLLAQHPDAAAAMRRAAAEQGLDPARLVFAPRRAPADHLARLSHADLMLDTFAYNMHTTASDALWAGVPVLTRPGRAYAARVAGSLLGAVGLRELIATSTAEYEALALALARDPARLAALRQRLAAARTTAPLFDTARFTRHLEAGWQAAIARSRAGLPPADIAVPAGAGAA